MLLVLKDIVKNYRAGDTDVRALKGVSINFRKSEFVSILGQSGCGKTTLLNIIGGLDRYTSGDLIINGKSTTRFTDADWDSYRNHSIGFVFQSYNLIQHQSVLSNVELALTLSGVNRAERRRRATEALEMVGLGDQLNKKPNEMSGGQMQRVAIARALVNDPDILLADEPTGALDSETSVQIMEILKNISKDKLIIMVTHNPELAERYSSRIIRLLDGRVTADSDPYEGEPESAPDEVKLSRKDRKEAEKSAKTRSMSYLTALSLSLNNLMTKKARTILTSFAGSIGIIGIALITALSSGMQTYIDRTESDTLAGYPLTIERQTVDLTGMMTSLSKQNDDQAADDGKAHTDTMLYDRMVAIGESSHVNDLRAFKKHLEANADKVGKYTVDVRYSYGATPYVYNFDDPNTIVKANPNTLITDTGIDKYFSDSFDSMSSQYVRTSDSNIFTEIFESKKLRETTYEMLDGKMPEKRDEVLLLLDKNGRITDYSLYTLGIIDRSELDRIMKDPSHSPEYTDYEYSDFIGRTFRVLAASDLYEKNADAPGYTDRSTDVEYMKSRLADALELKIVGVAKFTEDASSVMMTTGGMIGYLPELGEYIIDRNDSSDIVKEQLADPTTDVFTGFSFKTDAEIEREIENFDVTAVDPRYQPMFAGLEGDALKSAARAYYKLITPPTSYDSNLETLGVISLDNPTKVEIYCKDFDSKSAVEDLIKDYNKTVGKDGEITYTDYVGLMMSGITGIIDVVSYVLIAFVAISLVVSSIMIGIITYISVLERTKEIGILRAIGASKRDIRRVFNAETLIVGFAAGAMGILITVLLCLPINAVIHSLSGISDVSASLPAAAGAILVVISMALTFFAGLLPSGIASKKDPVVALRTE